MLLITRTAISKGKSEPCDTMECMFVSILKPQQCDQDCYVRTTHACIYILPGWHTFKLPDVALKTQIRYDAMNLCLNKRI